MKVLILASGEIPNSLVTHNDEKTSHLETLTWMLNSSSIVFFTEPSWVRRRDLAKVAMETELLMAYWTLSNGNPLVPSANACTIRKNGGQFKISQKIMKFGNFLL